jgi:two-component system CheB/CheR fusion protein
MISHFEGRLNAFSRVQSAVTRSSGGAVDVKSLIEDELLAVAVRKGKQLKVDGPELCLKSKAAESLSLAIHELATNAVKYGALSALNGSLSVHWERIDEPEAARLHLEWLERGLDTEPRRDREGFGHEMLLRTLPYDLAAETSIEFTSDGMRFIMDLPLGPEILAETAQ